MVQALQKVFGSANERALKRIAPIVEQINELEPGVRALSDRALREKTGEFRERLRQRLLQVLKSEAGMGGVELDRLLRDLSLYKLISPEDLPESPQADQEDSETLERAMEDLKARIRETIRETLHELLPEAFAVVREAARRVLGERPFDVQLVGGIVLHQGKIAEMATGEGKTLVATLPVYLNALTGRGVHVVTVNDYLAKRDRDWMGQIYELLGLSVGVIYHDMPQEERRKAYEADITYGTNSEFGFDYLRDNMALRAEDQVQRGFHYAIVDEVDSILIDEARTPLIISGPVERETNRYAELQPMVQRLVQNQTFLVNRLLAEAEKLLEEGDDYGAAIRMLQAKRGAPKNKRLLKLLQDSANKKLVERVELDHIRDKTLWRLDEELYYSLDEKSNVVDLTEKGRMALSPKDPDFFVLPDLAELDSDPEVTPEKREKAEREFQEKSEILQNIFQLLRAYSLFEKDVNYVVADGQVIIVDEFTGRLMPGRRYSDGLHQALEAKEGVRIEGETQTLATITIQNYFRMYEKLAGMTGTAETEAAEFHKIYKLDVVVIPTHRPCIRVDHPDVIFRTKREKYKAIIQEIQECHRRGQPVLVGTVSVEVSELLSRMLPRNIPHSVLNAKRHKEEAEIVARAGHRGAVTIATNMAGRGTDIKLGSGVVELGGLHIIGTERHEARRIDRQLRGRSGRQGDPGSSRFYLSLEDDLLRIFGSERIASIMDRIGMQEGEPIEHSLVTRAIENAQRRVEQHNFDIRKHLLEYDDVMNRQREVIYAQRQRVLLGDRLEQDVRDMILQWVEEAVERYAPIKSHPEEWDLQGLGREVRMRLGVPWDASAAKDLPDSEALAQNLAERLLEFYRKKEELYGRDIMRYLEKMILLQTLDTLWKEHLLGMDHLKEGIGLRGYAQRDPLREYQKEGYELFVVLTQRIRSEALEKLFRVQVAAEPTREASRRPAQRLTLGRGGMGGQQSAQEPKTIRRAGQKIGRNDPCPCGSGKKYKKCCGR
ncbi:MAG: preprotein translocase subunit SecA [Thermodesulfobacteriota bacterium]